jgi:hypothetical protein
MRPAVGAVYDRAQSDGLQSSKLWVESQSEKLCAVIDRAYSGPAKPKVIDKSPGSLSNGATFQREPER